MIRYLSHHLTAVSIAALAHLALVGNPSVGDAQEPEVMALVERYCVDCHQKEVSEGGLNLQETKWNLETSALRQRWVQVHDRIQNREMPPNVEDLPDAERASLVKMLGTAIHAADQKEVQEFGRGPMRRLNRDEFQQNLRDVLALPALDIRDMLPEDREGLHFNKTTNMLDMSRVQLAAYLDAAESALLTALASGVKPPPENVYHAVSKRLFSANNTFGGRQAMFFAKDSQAIDNKQLDESQDDPSIELALFRSAHWPYFGYPDGFVAKQPGEYRLRFTARAVHQLPGFQLKPAEKPVPMTFRARKRSGPDVSGDVRATGGMIDIQPEQAEYKTTVRLKENETIEYSLLGLPVPLARNVNNGPPSYRYPPLPPDGQPGVAFQELTITGPISSENWPPKSHQILFGELPLRPVAAGAALPVEVISEQPQDDARRLMRRFASSAVRQPLSEAEVLPFERLVLSRLEAGVPFTEAMLAGYKAFLCSSHMLYLHEPLEPQNHYPIASRLSHFLTNSRPDAPLLELARTQKLRNADRLGSETERLLLSSGAERFIKNFTDYWLDLRHLYRDEPDVRLYPEYRFDAYLIESMESETRAFFTAMIKENLPVSVIVNADFVFANDRLASHYGLASISGSAMRKVPVPSESPYGGLLTQAAILKVTANGTTTSPVVRGAWVMDRLLGQPPPPPPESVSAVEPDIRGAKTIRDLLSLHTKNSSCAGCHARFDPAGLALENFDILGGWRDKYRGVGEGEQVTGIDRAGHDFAYALTQPVDASGRLKDGRSFSDIRELKAFLATDSRQLARNLLQQWIIYSTGTPVRFSDRAEIESILDSCAITGYRTRDLLHKLIQSKIFLGPAGCH